MDIFAYAGILPRFGDPRQGNLLPPSRITAADTHPSMIIEDYYGRERSFSFLLSPNKNMWQAYVYDNTTGRASLLHEDRTTVAHKDLLTITIEIHEDRFTFYLDSIWQGEAISPFYSTGTVGLSVDSGADVFFSDLCFARKFLKCG